MTCSPIRLYRIPLAISSWLTFVIALTLYWITADPGVSYWDCPEYVTVASKMEVGHPPGNPIWMLAMRVVTIPFAAHLHAYVINLFSGLFMAFASFFLCRIILIFTRVSFQKLKVSEREKDILSIAISLGSSLCFAFCDSAWYSAVEAEVYAMSIFLASLALWIMTLWLMESNPGKANRLLILTAYLLGISLGVHQLNLLLIPVFSLMVLYKWHKKKTNPLLVFLVTIASCILVGVILMAFMRGLVYGAENFELFIVNELGLPYEAGVIIFCCVLLLLILFSLIMANRGPDFGKLGLSLWMVTFLLVGFSSFGVIMIRSKASPPMNEGSPDNIFAFSSYINREQYPSVPLVYGATPYSRPMYEERFINGKPDYSRFILKKGKGIYRPFKEGAELNYRSRMVTENDSIRNERVLENRKGYLLEDYKFSQKYTPELEMWFPRMTSRNIHDREAYVDWGGMEEENMNYLSISETIDSSGENRPKMDLTGSRNEVFSYKPTYYQNLRYFISYQSYYMYFRYLFWNFIGRQNDYPSNGEIEHGNFITGVSLIDNALIGNTSEYPSEIWENNRGRNRYFAIPFLIGIIGMISLSFGGRKSRRIMTLVSLLFLMTGLAIVVYLNQGPGEPRERDYTFLGSYMAFTMWIAAGLVMLSRMMIKFLPNNWGMVIASQIVLGPATLMAAENFDDHDRRNRYEPLYYASSILDFESPSIIFSQGDNSTFPLWYATEVLDMGDSHTIVDVTYLSLPSYVENLKKQGERGIQTYAETPEIAYGKFVFTRIPHDSVSTPLPINEALEGVYSSEKSVPEWPSSKIIIAKKGNEEAIVNLHDFTAGSSYLSFRNLMLLDLLASQSESENPKILFFPTMIDHTFYKALDSVLYPALFGKIYSTDLTDSIATLVLKESLERELDKLEEIQIKPHYIDPLIADRSVRYRGEMILASNEILDKGELEIPQRVVKALEEKYPYLSIPPGTFTSGDSTVYEGIEYIKLMDRLYDLTGKEDYEEKSAKMVNIMKQRKEEWLRFYNSLSPKERKTLSNRSKRLLVK